MAKYREPKYCLLCGLGLKARYGDMGKNFIGDTFLGYEPCNCQSVHIEPSAPTYPAGFVEWAAKNYDYVEFADKWVDKSYDASGLYTTAQLFTGPYQEYLKTLK